MNLYDYQNIKVNFHTHTTRCQHARGEDREYVEAAIQAGFKVLGFSDHAPYFFGENIKSRMRMTIEEMPDYVDSIEKLKKEYSNDIEIKLGLETEYLPDYFDALMEDLKPYPIEYMILGQHFFKTELTNEHVRDCWKDEEHLKMYVDVVAAGINTGKFLYVAHPDIIGFVGDEQIYRKQMLRLLNIMKDKHMPVEINLNGYKEKCNYPDKRFIALAAENGNDFIIGVDAHNPQLLLDEKSFRDCIKMAENAGGKVINTI